MCGAGDKIKCRQRVRGEDNEGEVYCDREEQWSGVEHC